MADRNVTDPELEALFQTARQHSAAPPSEDWLARVTGDALAVAAARAAPTPAQGVWAQCRDLLGGWRGVGGLAMAGVVGVAVGIAEPSAATDTLDTVLGGALAFDMLDAGETDWIALMDEG